MAWWKGLVSLPPPLVSLLSEPHASCKFLNYQQEMPQVIT